MSQLQMEHTAIDALKPFERNARTHSPKQIQQIARSIEQFGFNNPVLVDANSCIIAGHGRVEAAKLLGIDSVPTICLDHLTDAEKRALKDEVREAVLQAAEQAGAGNVPGNVKRMIQELTEPKIDWRELIAQQIESIVKADFSWQRPSRRSAHMDAIMPGTIPGNQIDVCVAVDTSGSVSTEMLRDFMTEIQGIMEQFDEYNLHVWCFDTSIYNPQKFTHDNAMDMVDYEPEGFGGTDFEVNWEWMKEEDIEPKKLIFFTDGYPCGGWGDPDYCETVWVIHGPKTIEPPFGIWAFYDEQ